MLAKSKESAGQRAEILLFMDQAKLKFIIFKTQCQSGFVWVETHGDIGELLHPQQAILFLNLLALQVFQSR